MHEHAPAAAPIRLPSTLQGCRERLAAITDLESKKETAIKATNFDFDYGSLLRFDVDGKRHLI